MKKKALWKDIFKEMWQSKARFLSIFAIITLGVAFFAGIKATGPDMIDTTDQYYQKTNLMDLKVVSTYGLEQSDIDLLKTVKGAAVQGAYSKDVMLKDSGLVTKVMSYPEDAEKNSNQYAVVSGRLPEKSGEIALDAESEYSSAYTLGDTVVLTTEDQEDPIKDSLVEDTYKVVGFVNSPQYIEKKARGNSTIGTGSLDGFAVIPKADFDMEYYTEAYLTFSDTASLQAYSKTYEDTVNQHQTDIEKLTKDLPQERLAEIKKEAQAEIDKGQKEIDEAKEKLADGQSQLDDAKKKLEDGQAEYEEGVEKLESEISKAQAELDANSQKLAEGKKELASKRTELEAGQAELNQAKQSFTEQKASAEAELAAGEKELAANQQRIDQGLQAVQAAQTEINQGKEAIQQGQATLDKQAQELKAGQQKVTEMKTSLQAAQAELAQAIEAGTDEAAVVELQQKIVGLQQAIPAAEKEIENGQAALSQGQAELDKQLSTIQAGEPGLAQKQAELEAAQAELNQGKEAFAAQKAAAQEKLAAGENEIAANQQQIDEGLQAIQAAETELANGETQLTEGQATLDQEQAKGQAELAEAKEKLETGQADYEKAAAEFKKQKEEADKDISDGEAELADAKKELADFAKPEYFVFDRSVNPGYAEYSDNADRISAIAQVFPVFFFLIAALVCLTTMTRMVDEQRLQIGTLKALGYTNWDISKKFLVYASLASVVGTVVGLLIGYQIFPSVIFNAYGSLYNLPSIRITYYISYGLISFAISILCTVASAYAAVRVALQSNAATLMRPKAPKVGQRILLERLPFIWNRMGFIQKVTARNLFRYKQRMLMTVLGVAGCTALILTGFGVSDSIADIPNLQYGKVMKYNALVAYNADASKEEKETYQEFIQSQSEIKNHLDVLQEPYTASKKGANTQDVTIFVPETTDHLADYVFLNDRRSGEMYSLSNNGVIITEKLAKLFDVKPGDTLALKDDDNNVIDVKVSQIAENYAGHYAFMTKDYYKTVVGQNPVYNTQLLKYQEGKQWEDKIGRELTALPNVSAVSFVRDVSGTINDTMGSLGIVTLVLIVSAGLLAFVVLYNLTNINVSERIRELSTIKVLGFFDKEVTMYIYRENIILTLMGILVGSFLGLLLHGFVLNTAEMDMLMFSPNIQPLSFLYSGLLTMLFSGIVMVAMHIKLKNIDMIEALKSVD